MELISTVAASPRVGFVEAVLAGLAPDGGLYTPERLTPLPPTDLESLRGADFPEVALALSRHLLGNELEGDALREIVESAFDFPVPLVSLSDGTLVLELFHGPTLAFKDFGARFMARVVAHVAARRDPLTVLVATSGDTGSAVAHAFLGLQGIRTVVLFPEAKVSPLQDRQFTTLGGNVRAVAVDGVFDDCQRMVKEAFGDPELAASLRLTSANSINVGRLLPQAFYYVYAWSRLLADAPPPVFATPSGNFGNLAAGLIAHRLGMPATRFVAATNVNDVVPEYLETGTYRPRPSVRTISNAMDVGAPSNLARIQDLYDGDVDALRADVLGSRHSDKETRARMAEVFRRFGYVLDPHTAVGHLGLDRARARHPDAPPVLLATAHPAKFLEVVEPVIGQRIDLPPELAACLERERRVVRIPPSLEALREVLTGP
jgi:threonine synthase